MRVGSIFLAGILSAHGAGCECAGPTGIEPRPSQPDCADLDGDGFGVGPGCRGSDCNDLVAEIDAQDACDAWCVEHGDSPGCPCDTTEPIECYGADPSTIGVGTCRPGIARCEAGVRGACVGETVPRSEICDERDDDCDGTVDDGVLGECGACGVCRQACAGPGEACRPWDEGTSVGVVETPEGWITLDAQTWTRHVIWPSSAPTGEILRVNTLTQEVEGSYWTGPNHSVDCWGSYCGDSPSRTAVDSRGDVVVANRAAETPGDLEASITKIAADPLSCPDADGDGRVETSTGFGDNLPFVNHDRWEDECILWHTTLGDEAIARAVVLDAARELDGELVERGWVGLWTPGELRQFDPETGMLTGIEVETPGCSPYGAAVDRDGVVWVTECAAGVGRFDARNPDAVFEVLPLPLGVDARRVLVDENDTPWFTGGAVVLRWRRDLGEAEVVDHMFPHATGGLASDGRGSIWVGTYENAQEVYRVSNDADLEVSVIETPGVMTFGMGADFDGQVWAFGVHGNAALVDVETEAVRIVLDDCGGNCLYMPYVRGDVTGLQRHNAVDPAARWRQVFEGCDEGATVWARIRLDALSPAGTRIDVNARTGDSLDELSAAAWLHVGSLPEDTEDLDLRAALTAAGVAPGGLLEIEVVLRSLDRVDSPTLRAVEVLWACNEGIEP